MLHRDISKFKISNIPETQGLKDQRMHSLPTKGKWLLDSLTQGYFSSRYDSDEQSWSTNLTNKILYESYLLWCEKNKCTKFDIESNNMFGKYLKEMFTSTKMQNGRGYSFGSLAEAISKFEKYEKITVDVDLNDSRNLFEWQTQAQVPNQENNFIFNSTVNNVSNDSTRSSLN